MSDDSLRNKLRRLQQSARRQIDAGGYDAAQDSIKSYYAAIAAKKARGDAIPKSQIGDNEPTIHEPWFQRIAEGIGGGK